LPRIHLLSYSAIVATACDSTAAGATFRVGTARPTGVAVSDILFSYTSPVGRPMETAGDECEYMYRDQLPRSQIRRTGGGSL
jgi:hypothetical protein